MNGARVFLSVTCLWASLIYADTIKIGSERVDGVLVEQDSAFYYVCDPETGQVDRVSKKRRDVKLLSESSEEDKESLRQAFEETEKRLTQEQQIEPTGPANLSGEVVKKRKALIGSALLSLQLELWLLYTPEVRGQIERSIALGILDDSVRAETFYGQVAEKNSVLGDHLQTLGTEKSRVDTFEALKLAQVEISTKLDVIPHEAAAEAYSASAGYWDSWGQFDSAHGLDTTFDKGMRNARVSQANRAASVAAAKGAAGAQRMAGVSSEAAAKRSAILRAMNSTASVMKRNALNARQVASQTYGEAIRTADLLERIALLNAGVEAEVRPASLDEAYSREFSGEVKTPPIALEAGGLICEIRRREGASFEACISVWRIGEEIPFTRYCSPNRLGFLAIVVDSPGEYRFAAACPDGERHLLRVIRVDM